MLTATTAAVETRRIGPPLDLLTTRARTTRPIGGTDLSDLVPVTHHDFGRADNLAIVFGIRPDEVSDGANGGCSCEQLGDTNDLTIKAATRAVTIPENGDPSLADAIGRTINPTPECDGNCEGACACDDGWYPRMSFANGVAAGDALSASTSSTIENDTSYVGSIDTGGTRNVALAAS